MWTAGLAFRILQVVEGIQVNEGIYIISHTLKARYTSFTSTGLTKIYST